MSTYFPKFSDSEHVKQAAILHEHIQNLVDAADEVMHESHCWTKAENIIRLHNPDATDLEVDAMVSRLVANMIGNSAYNELNNTHEFFDIKIPADIEVSR